MCCGGAGDADMSVFKRLAQDLQRLPRKFGELVQKQHPAMSQRHLARYRLRAAAEKPDRTYGVVRGPKRTPRHEMSAALREPCHGMYPRNLKRLFDAKRRQYGRYSPRDHGLARAGGANHQDVVSPSDRNLDSAYCHRLPFYVRKVVAAIHIAGDERADVGMHRRNRYLSIKERNGLLYTDFNRTLSDALANESILDMQGITEAISKYYYSNGESFDGLSVAPEYQERFDRLAEEAVDYYGN